MNPFPVISDPWVLPPPALPIPSRVLGQCFLCSRLPVLPASRNALGICVSMGQFLNISNQSSACFWVACRNRSIRCKPRRENMQRRSGHRKPQEVDPGIKQRINNPPCRPINHYSSFKIGLRCLSLALLSNNLNLLIMLWSYWGSGAVEPVLNHSEP